MNYAKPKPAKLADGTVQDLNTGYCIADIELVTRAGTVILPRSTIDILQGPEKANLIYIGEEEEKRLKLRSYKQQLEDLARKGLGKGKPRAHDAKQSGNKTDPRAHSQVKAKKSREQKSDNENVGGIRTTLGSRKVEADGDACVGEHN